MWVIELKLYTHKSIYIYTKLYLYIYTQIENSQEIGEARAEQNSRFVVALKERERERKGTR